LRISIIAIRVLVNKSHLANRDQVILINLRWN